MCEVDDDWAEKAMDDSTLVANLLLRIKNPTSSPSLNVNWTVRQRRSRTNRHVPADKKTEPARASPTTPLSWSAATSASGPASAAAAADGFEESSRLTKPLHTSRSNKVDEQNEAATANKRSRKKRSLPELLEEEKLLLKERRTLKDELASLHHTVEKQRATNESLKRMKLDLVSRQTSETAATSVVSGKGKAVLDPPQLVEAHSDSSKLLSRSQPIQEKVLDDESLAANASSRQQEAVGNQEPTFLLPDLNLPPEEEFPEIS